MTSREMMTDAMSESREAAKQEILDKIEELQGMSSMSYLSSIIALELVKTFIKFMDEE
jgi:hypothetical protein